MARIFSRADEDSPSIDRGAVLEFFEKRAQKVASLGPTRAVIYQDKNPDLAERRDAAEKALLLPLIRPDAGCRILDAGCGTGRWAKALIPACGYYHGVDVSPGLIEIANQLYGHFRNARFSVCSLDELSSERMGTSEPFSRILSCGVYIYLNDDEVREALRRLVELADEKARIIFREPVAVRDRLTLKGHFSDDMDQEYSAIYRTEDELKRMFANTVETAGFRLSGSGDVYVEAGLNNRAETRQRWFVWER